jgi:aminoglycoside phosphotransferase (APT) family kinase protein
MINEAAIRAYLLRTFPDVLRIEIRKLGSGVQGAGFLIELDMPDGVRSYVIKALLSEGLGHDYPSDRAAVFLLDLDEYKNLPGHVEAVDVLSEMEDGSIKSIGGGKEYYLLMERAEGEHYFHDLTAFSKKNHLEERDVTRIKAMTSYLAQIHAVKRESKTLYWRKLRDTIGHGECLMGVFDTYPDGVCSYEEMAEIIKKAIDWYARLKPKFKRLSQIHGDFHPGNIWFKKDDTSYPAGRDTEFILLDRSRGPWGEPADDVTALTVNYVFFSIKHHDCVRGAYREGLDLFFDAYIASSGDQEITGVVAPFFAFRGAVVANPVFYPEIREEQRRLIFRFIHNVLDAERFEPRKVNDYLR